MKDLVYPLVENALRIKYEDLPDNVVEIGKKFVLDTLAAMAAGSTAPGCSSVVDLTKDWGGKPESTILFYGRQVPSPEAAFCNGMMAHARELDDTHDQAALHAHASVLTAALAVAEAKGNVSGKEMLTAVVVGVDVMCRLGLAAIGPLTGWVLSSTLGYFGATIAAGKILGLDERKLVDAMGIAYSQCAGNLQASTDKALVKRMQPAFASRGAVFSAFLAAKGITGTKNVFEGSRAGFFTLYQRGNYDRDIALNGLGKVFEGANLSVKLYPSCRYTHGAIDGILNIVKENDIEADDVAEVVVHITEPSYIAVGKPFEMGEYPQVSAQFSIPYTSAVAILRRGVKIEDMQEENIRSDAKVLELAKRIRTIGDQKPTSKGLTPVVVDIKTKNSKVYSEKIEILRGDPRKVATMGDIIGKFHECARFCVKPLSRKTIDETVELVTNLEKINTAELTSLLF